jgi:hypothetical protein
MERILKSQLLLFQDIFYYDPPFNELNGAVPLNRNNIVLISIVYLMRITGTGRKLLLVKCASKDFAASKACKSSKYGLNKCHMLWQIKLDLLLLALPLSKTKLSDMKKLHFTTTFVSTRGTLEGR